MQEYDVVVIGDGVFGNVFLYELSKIVNNSQNFSVAHIFSETLAPACATRSTATVSANGIEAGISELGDDLYNAFLSFKSFYYTEKMQGIYPVKQLIAASSQISFEKLKNRYKSLLKENNCPYLIGVDEIVELDSYIVIPEIFLKNIKLKTNFNKIVKISDIVIGVSEIGDQVKVTLKDHEEIKAKKVIVATGAYSRIFNTIFDLTQFKDKILLSKIVAGSFLIKRFTHPEDLYLTINGHSLIYRKETNELIIGSTTVQGTILVPELVELRNIFYEVKSLISLDIGNFDDYRIVTGIRHKGQKRMPFFRPITNSEQVWFFSGGYKNGWSLPFYYAKREIHHFV